MKHLQNSTRLPLIIAAVLTLVGILTESALARPLIKLGGGGLIEFSSDGPSPFVMEGEASHLGKYTCRGEVDLVPGAEEGTLEGEGVVAIRAANGDLIVGIVRWDVDADGNGTIAFSWRDSVEFSDGTVVSSMGRFVKSRPPGAISRFKSITDGTSNIIAILIG